MALIDKKITVYANPVTNLPDHPSQEGWTAAALKAAFDANATGEIKESINGIIDDLIAKADGTSGADQIGVTSITDLDGTTVQAILESIRNKLKGTTDNSSGADFIGATAIANLEGSTVQAILEALKAYIDKHLTNSVAHAAGKISLDPAGKTIITAAELETAINQIENELLQIIEVDANVEVANARTSTIKGKTFNNLDGRLEELESDSKDSTVKINQNTDAINNISMTLPVNASNFESVSQWSDILIPDATRGKALLEFLLTYEESGIQITNSEQAMLVIMEEDRFDKNRQIPFDYDQIVFKLGQTTEVGQYLAWIEELLANNTRGVEKLELGLMLESGSNEIASNIYAMNVIMKGEQIEGLTDYRKKFAVKDDTDSEINRLDAEVERLDIRIDGVVV